MKEEQDKIDEVIGNERLIVKELYKDERKIKIAFFGIGILSLIVVTGIFYFVMQKDKSENTSTVINQLTPSPSSIPTLIPTKIPQPTPQLSPTPISTIKKVSEEGSIREYFISFGTGSNQTSDWTDVSGLQANIDFGNYQNIKEIRFEASVNVPTANQTVSVRLFNVTDKHPVWNSEVTTTNNNYVVSSPMIYDNGSKTYQVQMKTQLKYLANLTLARLHIILQKSN